MEVSAWNSLLQIIKLSKLHYLLINQSKNVCYVSKCQHEVAKLKLPIEHQYQMIGIKLSMQNCQDQSINIVYPVWPNG